jgi:hypothetical protein
MEAIVDRGMQVLIPPDAGKRKGARPGWDGGLYAFMRRVLASERGGELYAKRQGMIEPVFADTKFNRRCDRFQRQSRRPLRMAPDRHHAQLAQALVPHDGPDARLKRRAQPTATLPRKRPPSSPITPTRRTATFRNSHHGTR